MNEDLPVRWIGNDGTSHEISLDYAARIARWVFDTYGDVDEVDAALSGPPPSTPKQGEGE